MDRGELDLTLQEGSDHGFKAIQAASNVALDLDERPMPKIITLPRRRRRRPLPGTVAADAAANASDSNPTAPDTPEGNAAAARMAEAADRERMLLEDQHAH